MQLLGSTLGSCRWAWRFAWYPFLRRLGRGGINFILALTVGLLIFVVDMFDEAQKVAANSPASLDATVLVPTLALLTAAFLMTIGSALRQRRDRAGVGPNPGLTLAYQIAIGIGLHNFGEGLAIGSAFAIGEAASAVSLIAGFTLHNVTEGVGIAAPIVRDRPSFGHFAALACDCRVRLSSRDLDRRLHLLTLLDCNIGDWRRSHCAGHH